MNELTKNIQKMMVKTVRKKLKRGKMVGICGMVLHLKK